MGEGRSTADAASASSDDSVRAPPRLDSTRLKPGPGALPADAFDPLKHEDWEQFWYAIDHFFQPVNQDDVRFLRAIPVNPYSGLRDPHLRLPLPEPRPGDRAREVKRELKREKGVGKPGDEGRRPSLQREKGALGGKVKIESPMVSIKSSSTANSSSLDRLLPAEPDPASPAAALNSFPFTHRLVAAMLDDGAPGPTPAPSALPMRNNRSSPGMGASFWIGVGSEPDVRSYQKALEDRVKIELMETGLIDEKEDDELQSTMRMEQWKLRDTKTLTRMRKSALYTLIIGSELRAQAISREVKRHNDQVEIAYLERMVRNMKKNKKSRSKFQKLLQRMFGHYKDKEKSNDRIKKAAETISNGRLLTNGEDKGRSSSVKKKKKKGDMGPPPGGSLNCGTSRTGLP